MAEPEPLEKAFHKAVHFYKKGRLIKARQRLTDIQRRQPDLPDVLHLLSLIALQTDRAADAAGYLEKAVRLVPGSIDLFALLGGALKRAGRVDDALAAYEKALALDPQQAEVHYNMGNTLKQLGRGEEAAESYRRATVVDPGFTDAYFNLGEVLKADGRLEDAGQAYRDAVQTNPADAEAHMMLGNVLFDRMDYEAAVDSYRQALNIDPNHVNAHNNLGNALRELGRVDDAVESYRQAIKLEPTYLVAHENLVKIRWSQGEGENALSDLSAAAYAKDHTPPEPKRLLTRYLIKIGNLAKAQEVINDDPGLASSDAEALCLQGMINEKNGDFDDAMEKYSEANRVNPNLEYEYNKVKMDFFKGKKESAINQIDGICNSKKLNHSQLLSFIALKGHMLKATESEKYLDLFDYDTFVFSEKIDVPAGWSNLESFNTDAALELEGLHTSKAHPIDQTIRDGTQTLGNLFRPNQNPIIYALQAAFTAKIEKYIRNLPTNDDHVFLGNVPDEITYSYSWSVRLHSEGFHTNHVHTGSWLSSVYYVTVPKEIDHDADSKAGWLKFGEPPATDNFYNLSPDLWIKPQAGRLVLFPSYFWHGTEAFRSDDFRLTVAFDVPGKF